ncbi:TetR/AcrR family transcriptional regulator [Mesoterricola sediminis]|uniref:TetR family transcriptional regulator n=1 Tax=Mesoterricola sediminis TaxID=2927980 RepID=A0AA48GXF5_9BACT|nr:TetR/AcrR family transcriptional regulator [Mesoterricola sediminis]BDU78059.1 TetR family transcriptional regulator [Mesoterricola sediminis]
MPTPRRPKHARLDQGSLLAAALRVFAREGLDGASMRAIAREAGCDASLIYYYYENKDAIFEAVLDERLPPVIRKIRRLANPRDPRTTIQKLWEVIRIFREHASDPGLRSLVKGQVLQGGPSMANAVGRRLLGAQVAMRAIFRRGQRRGEVRPDLPPILATLFLMRMEAEILDLVPVMAPAFTRLDPAEALDRAERIWLDVYWRGIAVDPTQPLPFPPALIAPEELR